ncbi:MAG: sensor domain-containing diguanylate cyclase [Clostridia bacterium]|nr:sensor domain-containing diguanylate cyclase [Clostridia bacterium]
MDYLRKKYRILLISIILVIGLIISGVVYFVLIDLEETYHEYAKDSIMDVKKGYLKDTVNNIIDGIEQKNENQIIYHQHLAEDMIGIFDNYYLADSNGFLPYATQYMQQEVKKIDFTFIIVNNQNKEVVFRHIPSLESDKELSDEYINSLSLEFPVYISKLFGDYKIIIGVSQEIIDSRVKNALYNEIHGLKFADDAYVWVNQIVNYEGGDDYAIRRIHPNLKDSEGIYLSTNMTDVMGTTPYKTELEGVKQYGELFFQYYFKKLDSNVISEKITYAKLYKDFDWIIAMGVHLDDIQEYVDKTTQDKSQQVRMLLIILSSITIVIIIVALIVVHLLERWYYGNFNKTLIEESLKDPLTNTYNRRAAYKYLATSWSNFKSIGLNAKIMMIDIDNFKKVNDSCGHSVGDKVLTELADTLNSHIRSNDFLSRWGGEEFLLICNGLKKEDVSNFTKKLLATVENMQFECEELKKFNITVSIGVSDFYDSDDQFSLAVNRADMALYKAKAAGKNTFVVLEEATEN